MSIQDNNALALDTLSIIHDTPPHPGQPPLVDGIQLRWVPGEARGFPLKGGYYLFRRRVAAGDTKPACVMPRFKDRDLVVVATQESIDTGIGTLAAASGQLLKPQSLHPPGTIGIGGFAIDQPGLRFSLPANTTASSFTVRLQFAIPVTSSGSPTSKAVTPQVQIGAYRGALILSRQIVVPPPYQQDITISVNPPGADAIQISGTAAFLMDLCYAGTPLATASPIPASAAGTATPQSTAAGIPGQGWEIIPNLSSVIKLPLIHPQYPASPGSESINASMAIASSRVHYGAWAGSFNAATPTTGAGTITLSSGSPIVTGSGTAWTTSLVGSLIRLPLAGSDYTAYAVMAVLAPDFIVLSRSYSGASHSNASYQLMMGDDFAELHDRIAGLLQSPNDMRAATVPPPLDQGTVAGGKCVLVSAGAPAKVTGIGTQWTTSLAGCYIEIGPGWCQNTHLAGSNVYRIQAVNSASQLTLDHPFSGLPYFAPYAKCDFRIFARADGDDPNSDTPSFDFKPMDLLELASLMPSYAQALGLYWIDTRVSKGDVFDYIVIADHVNRFSQQVGNALSWLNGAPDFTGDSVDGFIKLGVKHLGSPPLAAPGQLELFRLPTGGARISIAHPDRADSDVGVSVQNAASWADPNALQPTPVMLNLSRLSRGTNATNLAPVGSDATGYDDLGRLLPSRRDSATGPNPPAGWPTDPIHFVDSGPDRTGLDVGWYSYRAYAIDLYGRFSSDSQPIPWTDIDKSPATVADAIHLADAIAPPPPAGVLAWILDDRDPYVLRDAAFLQWRSQFPDPAPSPIVGLRLNFRWPWAHQNQGPDLREFRVYLLENPINARTGRVTSVSPVSGQPTQSLVTLDLDAPVSTPVDAYIGASLQAGNRAFPVLASQGGTANQTTSVQLTVQNGGPLQTTPPDSKVDGAIVIPVGHPLHRELLNPQNWEKWLAAIPQDLAGTRYDVEMVEDPAAIPFDAEANTFVGAQATWNGSAFVLDAIPGPHQLTAVRPGIDVLALSSDDPEGYYVVDIQSVQVSGLQIVPLQLPDPVPAPTTKFQWRIGPANAGLRGLAGTWNATTRRLSLDGSPDLSNVSPGADLVYLAAPGATPANLDFFFAIESLDAVSHILTLKDTTHLSALPNGASLPWKIGRPVRHYEVFLPNPAVPEVEVGTDPATLLIPSLDQPVRHGTIGVSSVDKRNEVADQYWPARNRKGNESWLSGPAPAFRVMRDPVAAPTYTWNVTRLYATRANYHDDSYFTMRWNNPGAGYHAHVFRAMDSSLFLAHWKLNGSLSLPITGVPPAVPAFLASFDAHKTNSEYSDAAELYDQLDDATRWWLAERPELADAYMQVTIKPLDLSDPANGDRLGPDDDPNTFTANATVCAYIDTLPGKSTNKYFYSVMLLDGAQNQSPLGNPTPPVYLRKVVPPKTPVVTKIRGDERQIELHWLKSREPDVTAYRIYRSNDAGKVQDIRRMDTAVELLLGDLNVAANQEVVWLDKDAPVGIDCYYRVCALDAENPPNESQASKVISGRAVDTLPPPAPTIVSIDWVLYDKAAKHDLPWPTSGSFQAPLVPAVKIVLTSDAPTLSIFRRGESDLIWQVAGLASQVQQPLVFFDFQVDPTHGFNYRATAASASNLVSPYSATMLLNRRPGA